MARLIFVDAGVLIAAARGTTEVSHLALEALNNPDAEFASSLFVKMEVVPKAIFNKRQAEARFYEAFFESVKVWASPDAALINGAFREAVDIGLGALDALHVVAAASVGADEILTTERLGSPMHRTSLIKVTSIAPTIRT